MRRQWIVLCYLFGCVGKTQNTEPDTDTDSAVEGECTDGAPPFTGDVQITWCTQVLSGGEALVKGVEQGLDVWEQATPEVDLFLEVDCSVADQVFVLGADQAFPSISKDADSEQWSLFIPVEGTYVGGDTCEEELCVDDLVAHELGHRLRLGHSYEEGESPSEEEADALMAWSTPSCVCRAPCSWDLKALSSLYP